VEGVLKVIHYGSAAFINIRETFFMKSIFRWSIRTLLVVLVLIAILPAMGIVLYDGLQFERQAFRDANETAMGFTRNLALQMERITEATRQLLVTVANMQSVKDLNIAASNRLLNEILTANPMYENLFVVDSKGSVIAAAKSFSPQNVKNHKYYRDAVATKEFSSGEYDSSISSDFHAFHFSCPVLDKKQRVRAVIVAEIALEGDNVTLFKGISLPKGYAFSASDHRGVRIINDFTRLVHVGMQERPVFMAPQSGPLAEGTFSLKGVDGSERLYGYRRLHLKKDDPPYMFIRAGLTEDEALAKPRYLLWRNMILTGMVLVLGVISAWTIGNTLIVRRLKKLVAVSQDLSEGKTGVRTQLNHDEGELGELAAAFDKMAKDLEIREDAQRNLEASLRQSEAKYRILMESTPDVVFMVDRDGLFRYMNSSWSNITGYSVAGFLGTPFTSILDPDYRAVAAGNFQAGMKGEKTLPYRVIMISRNGSKIPMEIHEVTLYDDEGTPSGRLGVGRDLTERITADQVRQRLEKQLWQAQKMESMGTLAGGVAHDFNNVLAAIIGNTELALDETDADDQKECLSDVLVACDRAKNLIRQILSFSNQSEDQTRKPFDVKIIVSEALKLLRSSLPAVIEIQSEITDEETTVMTNSTQIHQLVMNLATNAAYAMREKGGTIRIRLDVVEMAENESIPLPEGLFVRLMVSDTGEGIDPAIMNRIFDPFFTTKKTGEGTGLGLSVVYGIVKSIGGGIDVKSEPGKGASFNVYLPRCPENVKQENDLKTAEIRRGFERILIVDDETALTKTGQKALGKLGYNVTALNNSVEALNLFRSAPGSFDLLMTDMTMPNMTGPELVKIFLEINPNLPIILCTGYTDLMTAEDARRLGVKEFVLKPVSWQEIAVIIRRVLDNR
jgi:PAS domain S-box-containing protein